MAGIESYVPDRVHTYSTRSGTQIKPPIGPCMTLVLHLVDQEMVPDRVHISCTRLGTLGTNVRVVTEGVF